MNIRNLIPVALAIFGTSTIAQTPTVSEPAAATLAEPAAPAAVVAHVAVPANSNMVTLHDGEAMVRFIQGAGYRADLRTTDLGPYIVSADSGLTWILIFQGCEGGQNCSSIQFYAGFKKQGVALASLNQWNRTHRYGRAYLDDNRDPAIEMDVNFTGGGLSEENFRDNLKIWIALFVSYREFVQKSESASQ